MTNFEALLGEIRSCEICVDHLSLGPRPIVRGTVEAKILIIGQAPGTRVHESGIPWDDKSGDRLREWLNVPPDVFYDERRIAIMPMGFCYPGRVEKGGDLPPRPECAPQWHNQFKSYLTNLELTLLVGSYAQNYYLKDKSTKTMTDTVRNWCTYAPAILPTPHPSWRSGIWLKKNPWFETDVLPELQRRVSKLV